MARVSVRCPNPTCLNQGSIEESHLGKRATCKKCSKPFVLARYAPPPVDPAQDRARGPDGIPVHWEPGDEILDLYEVRELAPGVPHAEGGMGRINRVWHRQWQKHLAVKSVNPSKLTKPGAVEEFMAEAEDWVDKIGLHPHVVGCHYARVLGGLPRVFVEFVDGGSLKGWIKSRRLYEGGRAVALERILDIAILFAWGLHYLHELGLIHQDVKPDNVMMTADGVARVTDFGLANARAVALGESDDQPAGFSILATYGGQTPAYCSYEQADIAAKRKAGTPREQCPKLTRRTDIWSWAVSVLEMYKGSVIWQAGNIADRFLSATVDDEAIPEMPPAVFDVLRHCLQRREGDRPHDMKQVAEKLRDIYARVIGQLHPREVPRPEDLLADSLNDRAISLIDLKKPEAAEQKWQEALAIDPLHPESTFNWGLIRWRSARMTDQKLQEKLREVSTSSADAARVDYLVGLVHLERTDAEAAVELLSKAAEAGSGRAEIASALALAQSLGAQSEQLPRTCEGHLEVVNSVSWSADGRFALSGSADKTLRLWEVSSGRCLRTFEGHTNIVNSVSWSPDGRFALSGSLDKTLRLWEVSSGRCLRTFEEHTWSVTSVSWSPDGRRALSGSDDNTLRLWEVSSGRCLRTFEGHTESVTSVSWSPDGRFALSGSDDNTLRLWEVSSGRCLRTFEMHTNSEDSVESVGSVGFSPDGSLALSGSLDDMLRLWEVSSGRCLRTFEGHRGSVNSVAWSPDGRHALSGSSDKTLRLWEVSSGRCLRTFEGHTSDVNSVAWSPDGRFALSGSEDKTLRLWRITFPKHPVPLVTSIVFAASSALYPRLLQKVRDALARNPVAAAGFLKQAREQPGCSRREEALELSRLLSHSLAHRSFVGGWENRTFEGHTSVVNSVAWSPDGRLALSGSWDQVLRLLDVTDCRCLRTFEGHTESVTSVSWSPDGRFALSGSDDNTLRLWEVSSGRCLRTFEMHTNSEDSVESVGSVGFSPDGSLALSGSLDDMLRLWEVSSGRCLRTFEGHTSDVNSVAWSPDGRLALSGSHNKSVRLWEVSSGRCLRTFEGHTGSVNSVAFSPDGRLVLSGCLDGKLRLWEVSSGRCLRTLEEAMAGVTSVAWSPDGRFALSGSRGRSIRLWEVSSGQCLRTFQGHAGFVSSVSWSPDGRFALSGSWDNTLRLWAVSSGQCLRTFEGHTDCVNSVSWSPDGRRALSGSQDDTLRLWELDWEFEPNQPADWDERARPFLTIFLTLHPPTPSSWFRRATPTWTEDDFQRLLARLGCAGFGWLRPEGVRRELNRMAATWQGPPALT